MPITPTPPTDDAASPDDHARYATYQAKALWLTMPARTLATLRALTQDPDDREPIA